MKIIETTRLVLRTWQEDDIIPYYQINQDDKVNEFLPTSLSLEQVKNFIDRMNNQFNERNYTLWAAELKESGTLIGFVGLNYTIFVSHFTPAVEIGWRLGSQYWGKGYATEAAKAALNYGFSKCGLEEIVSFAVPVNTRSIKVMEKIGMKRDYLGDFKHPRLEPTHKFARHILYRVKKII